jgi:hypothetical protein
MAIVPHVTPCFRCLVTTMPAPGTTATCDTAGVLATAVNIVASLEVTEGLKVLLDRQDELHRTLTYVDAWLAIMEQFEVGKGDVPCPACDLAEFEFLEARSGTYSTSLCGRDAMQINVRGEGQVAFAVLAERLRSVGDVRYNEYMLRFSVGAHELTVFPDGRAIIKGTSDESVARTLYSKYIGA